jgi:predicted transcriptional regulator
MGKSIIEIVGEIIVGQASQRTLSGEEIETLIKHTYRAFREIEALENRGGSVSELELPIGVQSATSSLHQAEIEQPPIEPKIDPRQSISADSIICVICGKEFKTLTHTHLKNHGLTPEGYRQRYNFSSNQPLTARSVSERRKAQAKDRNVGEQLRLAREAKKADKSAKAEGEGSKGGTG